MDSSPSAVSPLRWNDDHLDVLDQRCLPAEERYLRCDSVAEVVAAIRDMAVRGAPVIGLCAAYGVVFAARDAYRAHGVAWPEHVQVECEYLRRARPTAVNLAWALARMNECIVTLSVAQDPVPALLVRARELHALDLAANKRLGAFGAESIAPGSKVLTHCNAGALATAGYGTALGVIRAAHARGHIAQVYATETRPWLQGARLTAWELTRDGIPTCLLADGAAAYLLLCEAIDWVIVGADRVAANGDVANKIGTYGLALAARAAGAKFMVAAPCSTLDSAALTGADIPVEKRPAEELTTLQGIAIAAPQAQAWNPVFDVTPAALIDCLVTDVGVVEKPDRAAIAKLLSREKITI